MDDTISRQAAIDAIQKLNIPEDMCVFEIISHIEVEIATLPSAQPKHGKWHTKNNGFVVLDVCDQCMRSVRHVAPFYDYCPHCGAKMER